MYRGILFVLPRIPKAGARPGEYGTSE